MSRLTDLLREAKKLDANLGDALEDEVRHLQQRRAFGLNFERHTPEAVELYGRPVRVGDKVRMLPPRGQRVSSDKRLWIVTGRATVDGTKRADLREPKTGDVANHPIDDLVVVAEHTDVIYPGLVSTGKVERGGDKPFHTVINGENLHALKALLYTHTGKIDCVYIDPPYNTGAKDWKYNNDYVESDDLYRHSKWLAFMERRLRIARQLLNPTESVLIATIDEKECLRLGMLLEQVFPERRIQMVTSVTNVRAVARSNEFSRTAEYVFFVMIGKGAPRAQDLRAEWAIGGGSKKTVRGKLHWQPLRRLGLTGAVKRSDRPNLFYPLYVKDDGTGIHSVGSPIPLGASPSHISPAGTTAVWPIRANGQDGYWQIGADKIGAFIEKGYVKAPRASTGSITYLKAGERLKVEKGEYEVIGRALDGSILTESGEISTVRLLPGESWVLPSHDAGVNGTRLLSALLPDRRFPFPKSLYAVEDALRFVIGHNRSATVLDFFAGSGTTAHAVMRLNHADGGSRHCISVTNNEVGASQQESMRNGALRPGDLAWEKWGICDYITKPRIETAITGRTPSGEPVKGDYRFADEFPMADGLEENAEFFSLTYEAPLTVSTNHAFARIAPLLWLRAGSRGRRIESLPNGWDVAEAYGIIERLDRLDEFLTGLEAEPAASVAFIVTDDDRRFQAALAQLPDGVEPVRLYESYLRNFQIDAVRSTR